MCSMCLHHVGANDVPFRAAFSSTIDAAMAAHRLARTGPISRRWSRTLHDPTMPPAVNERSVIAAHHVLDVPLWE
jgi:hypothetical protein